MLKNSNHVDIFIIGAGINGMGVATDAAMRGLKIAICDQNDLGSATSSCSSKLIHGGLRYLEQYEFKLVRTALQERELLVKKFPHLIDPLKFIMPLTKNHRSSWLIQIGLFIYDHLITKNSFPRSKKISFDKASPLLPTLKKGFTYYDCYADDSRLVITNALLAAQYGAIILPRTKFISAQRNNNLWSIKVSRADGVIDEYFSEVLINASGPWCLSTNSLIDPVDNNIDVNLIKGSHIVVDQLYPEKNAYILQNGDGRIVFTIPFADEFTLIGTTEISLPKNCYYSEISREEIDYLTSVVNSYFKKNINVNSIRWSYSGIRCLQAENKSNPSSISRDYKYIFKKENNLVTIISGKLTTYRSLAEKIVNDLQTIFPRMTECKTKLTNSRSFQELLDAAKIHFAWLAPNLLQSLLKRHGEAMFILLKDCNKLGDLGRDFGHGLYEVEVRYFIHQEWAKSVDDILWRRTKLGLLFTSTQVSDLTSWLHDNS